MSSRYDALERLQRLRESGALSEAEFEAEKQRLLGHEAAPEPEAGAAGDAPAAPSRRPLYIILGIAALIAAIVAGLFLGGLVGRSGDGGEEANVVAPVEENAATEVNLVEAPPPVDLRALPAEEQLARAFEAAFGSRGEALLAVEAPQDVDAAGGQAESASETVRYTPGRLLWLPFGPVLISEGRAEGASHASAGRIAVHYLKPDGEKFAVERAFPSAVVAGSSGEVAGWSVSPRFSTWPVIATEGGGSWQGCTTRSLTLTELRPTGPVELVSVPLFYDFQSAEPGAARLTIEGKILNANKDESFDVLYSGSHAYSEHYVRQGNAYVVAGGGTPRIQGC
ncbi:SHOCT domain-containing protein [Sphingomonas parva]|uniref:SHOCT domain-containing protein n=1 Tax=Sphingomonas parva TaxID=2555898 RepID=A0A4Y8ZP71_9SPHN|nr:SHOCT domain-containing protein [Sphingomonas parva]TFI56629.1 SHOCT domain-containing protein [Sphingomonas parva]